MVQTIEKHGIQIPLAPTERHIIAYGANHRKSNKNFVIIRKEYNINKMFSNEKIKHKIFILIIPPSFYVNFSNPLQQIQKKCCSLCGTIETKILPLVLWGNFIITLEGILA